MTDVDAGRELDILIHERVMGQCAHVLEKVATTSEHVFFCRVFFGGQHDRG